ncbi:hypothetical protein LX36DRAFT_130897 [Colletotrichum falcatum]|nr:hypothetical protein LX36DRAFT_130897 [Colletotrichum falcatum]
MPAWLAEASAMHKTMDGGNEPCLTGYLPSEPGRPAFGQRIRPSLTPSGGGGGPGSAGPRQSGPASPKSAKSAVPRRGSRSANRVQMCSEALKHAGVIVEGGEGKDRLQYP